MPQVDFYILSVNANEDAGSFPCRLTEKAYHAGLKVLLQTSSEQESKRLDDQLWAFKQGSFLPHDRVENLTNNTDNLIAPILVGLQTPDIERDILINLSPQLPENPERFQRIAELVYNDETTKQAARERYRQYQQLGFEVKSHEIRG